jgi:hypothetical protein
VNKKQCLEANSRKKTAARDTYTDETSISLSLVPNTYLEPLCSLVIMQQKLDTRQKGKEIDKCSEMSDDRTLGKYTLAEVKNKL